MRNNGSADHEKTAEGNLTFRDTRPEPSRGGRCCHDCRLISPETETSYTLISSRYGWRLELVPDPATGEKLSIWRCPDCWRNRRAKQKPGSKAP
jgi:hypothetical protein